MRRGYARQRMRTGIRVGVRDEAGELRVRLGSVLGRSREIEGRALRWREDVRPGASEVRDPAAARREAAARLRDHQGDRGKVRRDVLAESGNGVSDSYNAGG